MANYCSCCRFFVDVKKDGRGSGECRRYAPRPMAERLVLNRREVIEASTVFPEVGITDWCGEFAAAEGEQSHAVLCLRTGHIDGWYSDRPESDMARCLAFWKQKLGHDDLVIISRRGNGPAFIRLSLNELDQQQ